MTAPLSRLAIAAVRAWTRLYTCGVPRAVRDVRREEIESDLWESEHDPDAGGDANLAIRVLARLLAGIPDDLAWRVEHVNAMTISPAFRVALFGAVAGAVGAWFAIGSIASQLPQPPEAPRFITLVPAPDPPPPPPPPPDHRALAGMRHAQVELMYGETSYSIAGGAQLPKKIKDVRPVYPPIAVAAGVSGEVVLEATIDERGRVTGVQVLESMPLFDQQVVDAVRRWQFEPAAVLGPPAQRSITITATFTPPAGQRAKR